MELRQRTRTGHIHLKKPKLQRLTVRRPKRKPRALIVGVAGQDGAYLAKLLLDKGYEVHGTSRDHEAAAFGNLCKLGIRERIHLHSLSMGDFRSVLTTLQKVDPHEIYSLAGQTSVGLSFNYPVETFESVSVGTLNLLECLRVLKLSARFYNAGSTECFGNTNRPADEKTSFCPRSPYAVAKSAAHFAVANYREAYGIYACTGILSNHESPLRPTRFVTQKIVSTALRISQGSKEKLSLGRMDVIRDWGWAPEYVEAMWKMLQQSKPTDYVVATGESHSLEEFVCETFKSLNLNYKEHTETDPKLNRPSDIQSSFLSAKKAKRDLKWKARVKFSDLIHLLVKGASFE